MELLIISGLSGSGKSRAATVLEDIGYYIVDNLPAEMMVKFADFCAADRGHYRRVALVYDVRAGEPFEKLISVFDELRSHYRNCRLLYLDCDTSVLINRYKETRRTHPLALAGSSIEQAVARERSLMACVREHADMVVDTSAYSVAKLRGLLLDLFGTQEDRQGLQVTVTSFGYKYGLPLEADLVFDVRFLPNPYYVPELKSQTGLDDGVRDFVLSYPQTQEFLEKLEKMLRFLLPLYTEEGKSVLVIAVGCTGGRHRSVTLTHRLTEQLRGMGYTVTEAHRDISR